MFGLQIDGLTFQLLKDSKQRFEIALPMKRLLGKSFKQIMRLTVAQAAEYRMHVAQSTECM